MSDDYETATRLMQLLEHVDAGHPLRLAEIRKRFNIDDACARRYRQWVGQHRELVEEREGRRKVWRLSPDEEASPNGLARAAALAFAVDALADLKGTDHHAELDALAQEARLSIPDGRRPKLSRLTRTFQARNPWSSLNHKRPEWLRLLMTAIQDRRPCRMEYERRNGEVRDYIIEPWGMVLHGGRLLLVAGKRESGARPQRRLFDVDGIQELTTLKGRFPEPPDREVAYHKAFEHSIGIYCDWPDPPVDVHLRVRGRHAVVLRQRRVHPSQHQEMGEDGWLDVRLRVVLSPDLTSFVLGMLPDVQVVAPVELKSSVEASVRAFSQLDRSDSDR